MAGLVGLVAAGLSFSMEAGLSRDLRQRLASDLDSAAEAIGHQLAATFQRLASEARVVAEEPRLKAAMNTPGVDRATVDDVAEELRAAVGWDLLGLADSDGRVRSLRGVTNTTAFPPAVTTALREGEGYGYWENGGRLYQVDAISMTIGGHVFGALLAGNVISDERAVEWQKATGASTAVFSGPRLVAASFPVGQPQRETLDRAAGTALPSRMNLIGEAFRVREAPLGPRLRVAVLRSEDAILGPYRRLRGTLFLATGGALLLAAGVAWLLARGLTRPIDDLVGLAEAVGKGNIRERVAPSGSVELVRLGQTVNFMLDGLATAETARMQQERMRRDLQLAHDLQLLLVSARRPRVSGLDVASAYRPAQEVGGDYLDFLPPPEEGAPLGLVVGDVSGKGVAASIAMAVTRSTLRGLAARAGSPAVLLRKLAEQVNGDFPEELFVTILVASVDAQARTVRFASAGHPGLGVVRAAEAKVEWVQPEPPCPGIGFVTPDVIARRIREEVVSLNPGDTVVLFTDGVPEATRANRELFGVQRFEDALVEARQSGSEEMVASLLRAIDRFVSGAAPSDDIAVIAAKFV